MERAVSAPVVNEPRYGNARQIAGGLGEAGVAVAHEACAA